MGEAKDFIDAVKQGDLEKVRSMLHADRKLADAKSDKGYSAVSLAVYHDRKEVLAALLASGATLDIGDASLVGDLGRVKELVTNEPELLDKYSTDGFTPLGLAAYMGKKEVVEFLIQQGGDVNKIGLNHGKYTALTGAVANGHESIVRLLLEKGADADYRYGGGHCPLMEAAANGSLGIVKLLLEHGADPKAKDVNGTTAREFAEQKGHREVAELLKRSMTSAR